MEQIGSDIAVRHAEIVETTRQATQFNVLQFLVKPPSREISVEVCLMDAEGGAIGAARWVQLNPLMDEEGIEVDNWNTIVDMTLKDINAMVKAKLHGMEF